MSIRFSRRLPMAVATATAVLGWGLACAQTAPTAPATAGQDETAKTAYANAKPQESLKKMSAVDKLLAIEEIRLLPLRYGRCITQRDWACLRDDVFAPDFYYLDPPRRVYGWDGFIQVMRRAGCYDRVLCQVNIHGHEVEILSPALARGIAAADFTYTYPLGQSYKTTGTESVPPGQQAHTPTYYYQTYVKVDGHWRLRTNDHLSYDLRRDFNAHTVIYEGAYVSPDGVRPFERPDVVVH
jgi:SnoaL-like domain